ncbi:MAG: DUF1659 domain-containing protein [Veillonellaceae bacterium]|jgi:hypothetical protein|nr:DUF1659 domain-containing protein [Veillonellaceae bacterium]
MAVNKLPQGTKLVIKVRTGVNEAGNPVFRQRSYSNIKTEAVDADMHAIGAGLASLQKHPVESIFRTDNGKLVEE